MARTQSVILILVIVVAAVFGGYLLSKGGSGGGQTIDLVLVESNPVTQTDSFSPENITVTHDTTVTLAIQNGDDEARTFEISAFNINQTIGSGDTERVSLTVGAPGTFEIYVPAAPPYEGYRASPAVVGYIIVS